MVTGFDGQRLSGHAAVERGEPIEVSIDGRVTSAFAGETVAAALMADGIRVFRTSARTGAPRGLYCGMGVCYECLVVVDGGVNTRACMTYLRPGMQIQTQAGWGPSDGAAAPNGGKRNDVSPPLAPTEPQSERDETP